MSDERVQVTMSADTSQAEAALERARVKAAFPLAVATVESFLEPRCRNGMTLDGGTDAIILNGAATVELAETLTAAEIEIARLRARLAKAEAPPY